MLPPMRKRGGRRGGGPGSFFQLIEKLKMMYLGGSANGRGGHGERECYFVPLCGGC